MSAASEAEQLLNNRVFLQSERILKERLFDDWKDTAKTAEEREAIFQMVKMVDWYLSELKILATEFRDGHRTLTR